MGSGDPIDEKVDVTLIDLIAQKIELIGLLGFRGINIPSFGPAVGPVIPAILALLQRVTKVERRLLGPYTDCRLASGFKQ